MNTVDCFTTTVRNTSGATRSFGFLGVHGMRLTAGQQVTVPGDLRSVLAKQKRKYDALTAAVLNGSLVVVSTPAPHVWDSTRDDTKVLTLKAGALGIADPCWGRFSSAG